MGAGDLGPPDDQSEGTSGSLISDPPGVMAMASGEGGRGLPLNLPPVGLVGFLAGPAGAQADPNPTERAPSARWGDRTQTLQHAKARMQGAGGQLHARKLAGTVEGDCLHSERLNISSIVGDLLELLQGALTAILVEILMRV